MKRTTFVLALLALIFIGLVVMPAFAQEVTPEPDQTVQVTVSSGTAVSTSEGSIILTVGELVLGVLAIFATGGVVGIGGAGYLANRLRTDPEKIAALERLANHVSPDTATQIMNMAGQFSHSVNELTLLVTEALDRIPAASKTPPDTSNFVASGNLSADMAALRRTEPPA